MTPKQRARLYRKALKTYAKNAENDFYSGHLWLCHVLCNLRYGNIYRYDDIPAALQEDFPEFWALKPRLAREGREWFGNAYEKRGRDLRMTVLAMCITLAEDAQY